MHLAAHGMPPHSRQATCGMRRNWVMASASTYTIHTWRRGILHTVNGRQCVTMSLGILWKNATIKTLDCARTASCDASKCIWAMSWFHPPLFALLSDLPPLFADVCPAWPAAISTCMQQFMGLSTIWQHVFCSTASGHANCMHHVEISSKSWAPALKLLRSE